MPEWDPEIEVDLARARQLVDDQFPELAREPMAFLAAGWDNAVYAVGSDLVFRFPQRSVALPGVTREIELLGELGPLLPVPVPTPRFAGRPSAAYPWPFFGAHRLSGHELAAARLDQVSRVKLGAALGDFLATLHHPNQLAWTAGRLPEDPMRRADMARRVPLTRERLAQARALGLLDDAQLTAAERLLVPANDLPPSTTLRLAHGDLHMRHVLVQADGQLSGVIDWGDMCVADPAIDLTLAFSHLAGAARDAFLGAYGPITEATELRARVLGLMLCAALAVAARDQGLAWLEKAAIDDLHRICAEA